MTMTRRELRRAHRQERKQIRLLQERESGGLSQVQSEERPSGQPEVPSAFSDVTVSVGVKPKIQFGWTTSASDRGYPVGAVGDRRFSERHARLRNGRTIEEVFIAILDSQIQPRDLWPAYRHLWHTWAMENPLLLQELRHLSCIFNCTLKSIDAKMPLIHPASALADILSQADPYVDRLAAFGVAKALTLDNH